MGEFKNQRSKKPFEVQGAHIVRSIGRKDRHSKVYTAKGLRDRRVRLSAQTAIQFYDVQDRLGYDRPSKAIDWLIKKAKSAIDKLTELSAANPNVSTAVKSSTQQQEKTTIFNDGEVSESTLQILQNASMAEEIPNSYDSRFYPSSFDSDFGFPPDFPSRNCIPNQDLQLSLQSLQDPLSKQYQNEHLLLYGATPLGGSDAPPTGWPEHHAPPSPVLFGENQMFSQRSFLQSSNTPSVRAWMDPEPDYQHNLNPSTQFPGFGSGFESGGFSRFLIPAQIPGEEEHDGFSDKPSSVSSNSRH